MPTSASRFACLRAVVPVFLLVCGSLLVASCGKGGSGDGGAAPPPPPSLPPKPPEAPPMRVSHVLIGIKGAPRVTAERDRPAAKAFASDLLATYKAGRITWDEMVDKFTDDRNRQTGKPNSGNMLDPRDKSLPPGTYVFRDEMVAPFTEAAKKTPVGEVYPTPVETEFGFHLIRRDK